MLSISIQKSGFDARFFELFFLRDIYTVDSSCELCLREIYLAVVFCSLDGAFCFFLCRLCAVKVDLVGKFEGVRYKLYAAFRYRNEAARAGGKSLLAVLQYSRSAGCYRGKKIGVSRKDLNVAVICVDEKALNLVGKEITVYGNYVKVEGVHPRSSLTLCLNFFCFLDSLLDSTDKEECRLWEIVVLTLKYFLEASDSLL